MKFPALDAARTKVTELTQTREQLLTRARAMLDTAETHNRDLTDTERTEHEQLLTQIETAVTDLQSAEEELDRYEKLDKIVRSGQPGGREHGDGTRLEHGTPFGSDRRTTRGNLGARDRLTREEKLTDWLRDRGEIRPEDADLSFDKYVRGMATGNWRDADGERELFARAMSEGTATAGGHLVPTPLSGNVIDLARNAMRVGQAGATFVPMTAQTLKIARLTGEGTPGWRAENAVITAADLAFDAVTFSAKSLNRLVTMSVELLEDGDPSAGDVVARSFAAQIALEVDRAALRGSGTAPEPRGVLNTSGITTTTHGANGAAITNYDFHLDAVGAVRNNNFEPTAHLQAPRTSTSLSKLKEATTNAYMAPPANMLPMLPTKQIPINLTVGTSVDCSELYTADWSQLGIGIRTQFRIEFLRERYADNGQVAFLAWFRGDVQLFQPSAFVVDTGVRG